MQAPDHDLCAVLRLARTPRIGPATYWQLLKRFGTPSRVLEQVPFLARRGGSSAPLALYPEEAALAEIRRHQEQGFQLVTHQMPSYPPLLAGISDPPPVFSFRGHPDFLQALARKPVIALVGTRHASLNALQYTAWLARALGEAGWIVVSGLARGIDAQAHEGSLATGTLGVLPGGLDVMYPPEHRSLADQMAENGGLLAEMPLGTPPHSRLFARRNRLVSGVAWGVAVIEAALRSGSLITARYALDQGREVFAVPGFPLDTRCQGGNQLIRQGAHLLEKAQDILDQYHATTQTRLWTAEPQSAPEPEPCLVPEPLDQERERLFRAVGTSPVLVDDLIRHMAPCPPGLVLGLILELELAGRLHRLSTHRVIRPINEARTSPPIPSSQRGQKTG